MKYTKKIKEGITAAIVAFISLSAYPVAYAQLITSQHGQAQRGATADSGTPINAMAGIDRAPSTAIGGGLSNNSSAATQNMESKVDLCDAGFSGTKESQRKFYTRADGSIFYEAWYLTKNNCKPVDQPLTPQQIAQVNNMISTNNTNIINQVNQILGQVGGGGATPVFSVRGGALNDTTAGGSATGFCVDTAKNNGWANLIVKDIVLESRFGQMPSPWPNWPGRPMSYNQFIGRLCPAGMGFTVLSSAAQDIVNGE